MTSCSDCGVALVEDDEEKEEDFYYEYKRSNVN